ncbi:AAA family ATPase [Maridesulfovibrio salexigens]|uniref:Sensory/regulatory protein RpfC n=1 Tax=Maridesulfovibrio salexigens (strain ATCC 14822 / DSM 2638 / NCIMB 8403 / VKM B-1763) TaxID=526222 RepID=C6BVI2_MARSD|nr:AAA family ATPase [Maridesulfovibrio salexigens]ACS78196.1 PAS sensor protein [Maridesulfovibrio salexigens DSM 2638]
MINLAGYENVTSLYEGNDMILCRAVRGYDDLPVLIKYPNSELPSPRLLTGLKNEYATSQEIGNTGIVPAVTLHRTDNSLALILEDKGYNLLSSLITKSTADLAQKLQIALRIASSISLVHTKGFLHRSIRPDSIAIAPDYREALLTNLQNSTRIADSFPQTSAEIISPDNIAYISPEQSGRVSTELDRRSDFYSLGITLFELFTGQKPFESRDDLELIHCHLAKEPPTPHSINPEIPSPLSAVIMKLLSKNPGDRYQSAHGIKQDLKACMNLIGSGNKFDQFTPGNQDISETFILSRKLFGRKEELNELKASFSKVVLGSCETIFISGEAGTGKSSLINSFSKHVYKDNGEFISGKFDQFRRNRPYSALIQAFKELLRKRLSSPTPVINAWKHRITSVLEQNASLINEVLPELELLIGKQPAPAELSPTESRDRFNLAFKNFIKVFPSIDKPLVLFLDDLQWADISTLQLIKRLLEDQETSHLMLICAYRTNLPMNEGIKSRIEEIEELSPKVSSLKLNRLKLHHVHGFISRTLKTDRKRTEELARMVYSRTGGNPLFVREYMLNMYRADLITFDNDKTRWEWDLNAIRNISMDGNLVELMAEKIMTQPPEGQDILKAASGIGCKFDLRILTSLVDLPEQITLDYLNMALHEGLIISDDGFTSLTDLKEQSGPYSLSFMHDRVQQAAYSMLDASEKTTLHHNIGRAMLAIYSADEIDEASFEIAAQYSLCISAITDPQERKEISMVFTKAGRKAKRSSAFETASRYLSTAALLIGSDGWETSYRTSFDLHLDWYECEFLNGSGKQAENVFKNMIGHSQNRKDTTKAQLSRMQLFSDQGRYHDAVKIGLDTLQHYDVIIPQLPGKTAIAAELLKTKAVLGKKKTLQLYNLPEMDSPDNLEVMRLLMHTIAPAYMFNKKLVFFIVLRMIRFSVKHGNGPYSSFGYMFYAMFLASKNFSFKKSKEFTRLAVELNKKFRNTELETKINTLRGGIHDHWHVPLQENINTLDKAFHSGLMNGDNTYARYAGYFAVQLKFMQGHSIEEVYSLAGRYLNFIQKNKNSLSSGAINLPLQMCKSMEGKTYTPGYLDDDNFREGSLLSIAKSSGSEVVEKWTATSKLITLSFFGYHTKAIEYVNNLYDNVEKALFGMYSVAIFHLLAIINMAALFNEESSKTRRTYLKRINHSLSRLEKWEKSCPENFRHLYLLGSAELARIKGNNSKAMGLYEEAISFSAKAGCNSFAALACELAGRFHFSIGGSRSAIAILAEACHYYEEWGASAKVQRLLNEYPQLHKVTETGFSHSDTTGENGPHSLDISAVLKASQAISGEIVLNRLLDKLMRIVIENAGAQKATLLLNNKNRLELTSHAFVSEHGITTKTNPDPDQELYCKSIVNYVLRSKDNIVLRDAGTQGPFSIDSYIIRNKPKSILAMPVINQQLMRGVLYLENNLSPGVFTDDRLEVLNLLCSQAAISIQNARLYSDLRDSETQHRTLLESINVGVFRAEADADGLLLKANRALAEMFGYRDWNEFRKTQVRTLYIEPQMHQKILDELLEGGIVRDREINMRKQDGTPIWVNMTASMERNGNKENCLEGVLEDITEKRKAQEFEKEKVAANAANKAKSDFLASMSHEIRTPMNAILGMADLLWESRLSKIQRNYVKIFRNAGENLLLLINDILDLSKIEAGQIDLEEIDFNLEELFEEIGSIFALRAQIKSVDFCWYIDPEVPRIITGDPTRLRQIIVNLVGNSLKFTEKGTIIFEAGITENGYLRFLVKDTGVGIPVEKMNSIFDTFSQADSSTTRNYGGTGLGLSICSRMVESMGGGIFVSSTEGEGADFSFTINAKFPIQPEEYIPLKNCAILLVDRECICRDYLSLSLSDLGAKVYSAESLGESSSFATEISYSAYENKVLLVGNPEGEDDRFEILKKLKHGPCQGWKLMMIMEAKPQPRATARAKQLCASYVHRPVHPQAIVEDLRYAQTCNIIPEDHEENEHELDSKQVEMIEVIESSQERTSSELSILLVEDSEDNRMVIDLFLKDTPYIITYAENGQEGLEQFKQGEFGIVLMDIQMPIMDGYEATKAIRQYEEENQLTPTPIMALTANAFQDDEQRALASGCTAHMAKPVKKKKLLRILKEYLG